MMQSFKRFLTFAFWLVIFQLIEGGHSFSCSTCDGLQCRNASEAIEECTTDDVRLNHQLVSFLNPTLPIDAPQNYSFGCFSLDMLYESPLTGSSVRIIRKGCTYTVPNFCEGWTDAVLQLNCTPCATENCNAGAPPSPATTTVTPPTTTTTASSSTASSTTASPTTASPSTASPPTASPPTASPSTASPSTGSPTTTTTAKPDGDKGGAVSVSFSIGGVLVAAALTLLLVH